MFTTRGTATWICDLMLVAVAVSLAIASEDDMANGSISKHLVQRLSSRVAKGVGDWNDILGEVFQRQESGMTLVEQMAYANQKFSMSMYHWLAARKDSFVFSPYNLHMALTLMSMGASKKTADEIRTVLGLTKIKLYQIRLIYTHLTQSLKESKNVTLHIANAVFTESSFPIKDLFKINIRYFIRAGFKHFIFENPNSLQNTLNEWVSKMTAGKISSVLKIGSEQTTMAIISVAYFKGAWLVPFNPKGTKEQDFYKRENIKVKVLMMNTRGLFNITESNDLRANILELPYADKRYSMLIILPNNRNDLRSVEQRINHSSLNYALSTMYTRHVNVFLPKFKDVGEYKLRKALIQMGMVEAFSAEDATFDEITPFPGLYITDVYHKVVIEVTEDGTEAAATMKLRSNLPTELKADHPFMYFIRDKINDVILFGGKYSGEECNVTCERTLSDNLAVASQNFSVSMYHMLEANNPNFVFSPYSVHTTLTMMSLGASKETEKEMMSVLNLRMKEINTLLSYSVVKENRQNPRNITLHLASAVFMNSGIPVKDTFKTGLPSIFQVKLDKFNFNAPGGPEEPINQWVSNVTAGKISRVLKSGSIQGQTSMLILNAAYFKGLWLDMFNSEETQEEDFYVTKNVYVKVPMMTREGLYRHAGSIYLEADIVELPYADSRYSLVIILPTHLNDLDAVVKRMDFASLIYTLDSMNTTLVTIYLPKFKVESEFKLKETLKQMGLVKAFDNKHATFSGISFHRCLYISDVYQKAVFEVTEEGTRDSSSSFIFIDFISSKPVVFNANHPFMYMVWENVNKVILFWGKYSGHK